MGTLLAVAESPADICPPVAGCFGVENFALAPGEAGRSHDRGNRATLKEGRSLVQRREPHLRVLLALAGSSVLAFERKIAIVGVLVASHHGEQKVGLFV